MMSIKDLKAIEGEYHFTHKSGGDRFIIVSLEEHDDGLKLIFDIWPKERAAINNEEVLKTVIINLDENT